MGGAGKQKSEEVWGRERCASWLLGEQLILPLVVKNRDT